MDRRAWWAIVPGVAKNQTRLSTHHIICLRILKDLPSVSKVKNHEPMQEMQESRLPEKEIANHSSIFAW